MLHRIADLLRSIESPTKKCERPAHVAMGTGQAVARSGTFSRRKETDNSAPSFSCFFHANRRHTFQVIESMVLLGRIELPTSPLPRVRSTTELQQRRIRRALLSRSPAMSSGG